ncbi:MAG: hypothetical protein JW987_11015 [Anaerolineaceae bacterium]|nr:hypothetical protein [Anaerolineaceae bacterium]
MKRRPVLSLAVVCLLAALACEIAPTAAPTLAPPSPTTAVLVTETVVPTNTAIPTLIPTPSLTPTVQPDEPDESVLLTAENIASATRQGLELGEMWIAKIIWPAGNRLALWLAETETLQEVALRPLALSGAPLDMEVPGSVLAIAPDGSTVTAQGGDGGVIVKGMQSGAIQALAYGVAYGASYDPRGEVVAVFSPNEWSVTLFEAASGEVLGTQTGFETAAPVYAVTPAGRLTILWTARATAQFQDVSTGLLSPALGYMEFITDFTFSDDGTMLALVAGGRLDLMPVPAAGQPAQPVTLLDSSLDPMYSLSFSPDGRLLAVGQGSALRVWDVSSHTAVAQLTAGAEGLRAVSFSPDGTAVVALDNANVLHVWQVEP